MSKDINLLPIRKKIQQSNSLIITQRLATWVLIVTIIAAACVFALNLDTTFSSLVGQENYTKTNLTLIQGKTLKLYYIEDRLKLINNILIKDHSFDNTIDQLTSKLPDSGTIDSLQLADKKITMTVSSVSLNDIKTYIDFVTGMINSNKLFQKLVISGVTADALAGKYSLHIEGMLL